jgi:hypothetical protein
VTKLHVPRAFQCHKHVPVYLSDLPGDDCWRHGAQLSRLVYKAYRSGERVLHRSRSTPHQIPTLWHVLAEKQRREESERGNGRLKLIAKRLQSMANDLTERRTRQLVSGGSSPSLASLKLMCRRLCVVFGCAQAAGRSCRGFRRGTLRLRAEKQTPCFRLADVAATPSDVHIREGDRGKCLAALKVLPLKLSATTEAAWTH